MEFSEKLTELRRREGLSQEQLASRLGVTRQSVSKWESGAAMPELSKLLALSALFSVSLDALVKPELLPERGAALEETSAARLERKLDAMAERERRGCFAYTSRARLWGLPLVSVRFGRDRSPTRDTLAVGVVAVGNFAVGVVSLGLISLGVISLGMIALGGLALGLVSMGYAALGVSAVGIYAAGAAASGVRLAVGAAASGAAAIGREASGAHVLLWGDGLTRGEISAFLAEHRPELAAPIRAMLSWLGGRIQ